jgi:hypothetical protein
MVNIIRMYAIRNGEHNVFDVPRPDAKQTRRDLVQQGWIIYHSVLV